MAEEPGPPRVPCRAALELLPAGPVSLRLAAPASKSVTNRALLCAALAEGTSHLHGAAGSDDAQAMATALAELGAGIDLAGPGQLDGDGDRGAAGQPGPAAGRAAVRDDHAVPGRGGHPDPGGGDRDRGGAAAPAAGGAAGGGAARPSGPASPTPGTGSRR